MPTSSAANDAATAAPNAYAIALPAAVGLSTMPSVPVIMVRPPLEHLDRIVGCVPSLMPVPSGLSRSQQTDDTIKQDAARSLCAVVEFHAALQGLHRVGHRRLHIHSRPFLPCLEANRQADAWDTLEKVDNCSLAEWIHDRRDREPDVPLLYLAAQDSSGRGDQAEDPVRIAWVESWSPGTWRVVSAPHWMDEAATGLVADAVREVIDLAQE